MHAFEVTVLGCSSATPTSSRHPTSQILNVREHFFLLDCGEATQIQLRRFKFKMQRINHIFISHLHGDHYLGLPGLLGTMHLLGREKELHIHAPAGLEEIIKVHHHHSRTTLRFNIHFHVLDENNEVLFENDFMQARCFKLEHRIPCFGFVFEEKIGLRNMIKEQMAKHKIPADKVSSIKQGADFIDGQGRSIANKELTTDPPATRKYCFCTDTAFNESYLPHIQNANLLYHEATFTNEHAQRAKETYHCTASQAASIASQAKAKQLLIGHYSVRYKDLSPLLNEAKSVFNNTLLAEEGKCYQVES